MSDFADALARFEAAFESDTAELGAAACALFAEAYGAPLTPTVSVGSPADPTIRRAPRSRGGFAPSAVWVDEAVEFAGPPSDAVEWSAENPMLAEPVATTYTFTRGPGPHGWADPVLTHVDGRPVEGRPSEIADAVETFTKIAAGPTPALVPHVEAAVERRRASRAVSPRVPVYRDDRPRWRSPYGPAGRR